MDVPALFSLPASPPTASISGVDRTPYEDFLVHEARLLDDRRFEDWSALFTEDGLYWVPATDGQESPYQSASLFFDDRELMKTRIDRLGHPQIHVQTPPSRTNHIIANVVVEEFDAEAATCLVSSSVWMAEYRLDVQRIFAARQYHRLRETRDGLRIVLKRVHLINCDSAFEAMAVPI